MKSHDFFNSKSPQRGINEQNERSDTRKSRTNNKSEDFDFDKFLVANDNCPSTIQYYTGKYKKKCEGAKKMIMQRLNELVYMQTFQKLESYNVL